MEEAHCQEALCGPSRTSILTSRLPQQMQVLTNRGRGGRVKRDFIILFVCNWLKRTYYRNDPRDQLFWNQNKYFALRILSRSRHNFVLIYFFVNKYVYCLHNIPDKRRLVTSKVCFCSEIVGLLESFL